MIRGLINSTYVYHLGWVFAESTVYEPADLSISVSNQNFYKQIL